MNLSSEQVHLMTQTGAPVWSNGCTCFFMHIQLNNHFSEYDTKFSEYGTSVIVLIFIFAANIINNRCPIFRKLCVIFGKMII